MGDKNFRLAESPRPLHYRFRVSPDIAAKGFRGTGQISLVLDRPQRSVTLHGADLEIRSARVLQTQANGGAAVARAAQVRADPDSQTIALVLDGELAAGEATIEVEWTGHLQADLRGMYLAGGVAVTQFEAADARRVFPCFDEPLFKAEWSIEVEAPSNLAVIGNGAVVREEPLGDGRRLVVLAKTPKMSSYLVALVVGELVPSDAIVVRGAPLRTWATPDKAALTGFAQECASTVLPLLEDYFGCPYVFGKVDQVGVPDFEAGAMENSGCITFREILLLADPERTPLVLRKRIAEVITHELAHQWFGNLVTMKWWDDLWLNEAFATWMAFKIVDAWRPQWRMWDDFEGHKAAALRLDALVSTHPIRADVHNAEQATENFDLITYEKGGAMLRMIEGYLGEAVFRDGIRSYMKRHAFANAVADDLWNALGESSGQPVERLANDWIGRPGFPLVEVRRNGARIELHQRRFYADPHELQTKSETEAPWLVPLVFKWGDDAGIHESRLLLGEREGTLQLEPAGEVRYVCANRDAAGFYRVKYEPRDLVALSRHRSQLTPVERIALVADASALFRAQAGPFSTLLDLLVSLADDEDYVVLDHVGGMWDVVERRFAAPAHRPLLRRLVASLLGSKLTALGWEPAPGEADDRRLARAAVIRVLALTARSEPVVQQAVARMARVRAGERDALDTNLLDTASLAAARVGDEALFDALIERTRREQEPSEKRRSLVALASFEAPALVGRAIGLMSSDVVPLQDLATYYGALLANEATRPAAWDFLRAQWSELRARLSPMLLRRVIESLGELIVQRAEVEAFFAREAASLQTMPQAVSQTRERLRLDEEARHRAEPELAAWLGRRV